MFEFLRNLVQGGSDDVAAVLAQDHIVIDVRSPQEFAGGHVAGSKNIPLQRLSDQLDTIAATKPIVFCCASGARSGSATSLAKQAGRVAVNGGPWTAVNRMLADVKR